jgi:hypothetical protein
MISSGIRWQFRGNHIVVHWFGDFGLDAVKIKLAEILKTCREHHCKKVLIHADTNAISPEYVDLYELGAFFEKIWQRNIRVAMLVPLSKIAKYEFFETVAKNRGLLIETFSSSERALDWLDEVGEIVEPAAPALSS